MASGASDGLCVAATESPRGVSCQDVIKCQSRIVYEGCDIVGYTARGSSESFHLLLLRKLFLKDTLVRRIAHRVNADSLSVLVHP
jgi:hypothetical protein